MIRNLLAMLEDCPLIVSAQASPGAAVDDPETLFKLAKTSVDQGVQIVRLEGAENIRHIRPRIGVPVIGLIKKRYGSNPIYITPTMQEVKRLLALECEIIALDASPGERPDGSSLDDLVAFIHERGALAMADCDCHKTIDFAYKCDFDLIGTTMAGYTDARPMTSGPDFDLVRYAEIRGKPVIAEGRYSQRWQVQAALNIGASGVVVGGAINDPLKQTLALIPPSVSDRVGAVDLGGTWIRFAVYEKGELVAMTKTARQDGRQERLDWIQGEIDRSKVVRVGVSSGGTIDPSTGEVWEAKPIIPDHVGTIFKFSVPCYAINDGLATAWGHSMHPLYAGKRVLTLALGTGVGGGFVADGKLWHGRRGEYPRFNDFLLPNGDTVESALGGFGLTDKPTKEQQYAALDAVFAVVQVARKTLFPDSIVVCGGVGLAPWMEKPLDTMDCAFSPYGSEAGLHGAASIALNPPT